MSLTSSIINKYKERSEIKIMLVPEYTQFVGRMKQPLQEPEIDIPSMYAVADSLKAELDLIILTPGSFLHAYNFIKEFGAKSVRLFTPSLRPEFISDIFNYN